MADRRARRGAQLLPLALLLGLAPFPGGARAAAAVPGVEAAVVTRGPACVAPSQLLDALKVNYRGTLREGGAVFDENLTVGRPLEFHLGRNAPVPGWDAGLLDLCPGDRVILRLAAEMGYGAAGQPPDVPPGAALVYDVTVLQVNDQVAPPAAADLSEREFCFGCVHFVEAFWKGFHEFTRKKASDAQAQRGGGAAPAITYDDDMEAYVQAFCDGKQTTGARWAGFVRPACAKLMQAHKREIVGKFLGKELGPKEVLARKLEICTEMGRACPADLFLNQAKDPCGLCRRLVRDLEYEYAVQGPGPAKKPPAERAWTVLRGVCEKAALRHKRAARYQEHCEDAVEDHGNALAGMLAAGGAISGAEGSVEAEFCAKTLRLCPEGAKGEL